jgi:hypothetical protein
MTDEHHVNRYILEVLAHHEAPLLALVANGRWRIVTPDGAPISDVAPTPISAWKSAAEKVRLAA